MADPDTKFKHSLHYKRNLMAKALRDQGDHKGAFKMKVIDSRKKEYKRERLRVNDLEMGDNDGE